MANKKAVRSQAMEAVNFYGLEQIIDAVDPSIPIMLHGPPGIGKSAWLLGQDNLQPCTQIGLATRQPEDISGCPYPMVEKGITKFLPLDWLYDYAVTKENPDPQGCMFFDEYDKGTPEKQVAVMRLLSEREMEGLRIGPNVRIILAANRREDQAGAFHDMPRVVRNRLMHFEIWPSYKYWLQKFAYDHGNVHPLVTSYLDRNEGDFVKYDPKTADFGFPTARSWTGVSKIMHAVDGRGLSAKLAEACIVGLVGKGIGTKFKVMIDYMDRIPKLEDLVSGKAEFPIEGQFDEWIALLSTCVSSVEGGIKGDSEPDYRPLRTVCELMMKFPKHTTASEFELLLARNLNERPSTTEVFLDEDHHQTPGFNAYIAKVLKKLRKSTEESGLM